ncbi:glycosyltransferase family 2 protein [Serratia rhizosphaerae]
MPSISVCILTHNSERLLRKVLPPALQVADELIIVDSGSTDSTLEICRDFSIHPKSHPFETHGRQMNFAIGLARHDWILCLDSDEIMDETTVKAITKFKLSSPLENQAYRIKRIWFVLGKPVRTIYPVSSPDYPIRLFNRTVARFNDSPVDDAVEGSIAETALIPGSVHHDTFHSIDEVFNKLNNYTRRAVKYRQFRPSIARGIASAIGAFFKWYLFSGSWKEGWVGIITGFYATAYSFLKYFRAWCSEQQNKSASEYTMKKRTIRRRNHFES